MVLRRISNLLAAGQRMQAQAMEMHHHQLAVQGVGAPAGPQAPAVGERWDPTRFLPAPSAFVKRVTCSACGAPKQLPSVREYLYCDFCGQLTDYDLRRAAETAAMHPAATSYAAVANAIGPQAERARRAGDRATYQQLQHQLHSAQVQHTPWVVPPRAWADPDYAARWVRWSTEIAVLCAFDPVQRRHAAEVRSRALRLRWHGGLGIPMLGGLFATIRNMTEDGADLTTIQPTVVAGSFWPLADAVLAQADHAQQLITAAGLRELDPDGASPAVAERLAKSVLAQGWLRSLREEDGLALIERLGLRHEYSRAEVGGEIRHCAGCGHDVTALPGARCVVCDGCGRRVDLTVPQVVCTGCNARIAFAEGATHVHCPYCAAEVRRT